MEPIISVRDLGKSYRIQSGERKPYRTMRDDLVDFGKGLLKGQWGRSSTEEFWALKDINFDVYPGEVVGIIGRNGAGKSTLLKILSRIVEPTTGEIILHGRLASLLEVGTGFHPELTGRENIYLNGAILGMSQAEIKRKFDEIVDFAEVEKFLDTPVKRYSSGMYVRLAFAVAAHLEPEILIVDEVLAVGDVAFQKKCLGKMNNIAKNKGRTILFVSHSMSAIQELCEKCIVLKSGKIIANDRSEAVIHVYLNNSLDLHSFNRPKKDGIRPELLSGKIKVLGDKSISKVLIEAKIFTNSAKLSSVDIRLTDATGVPTGFGSLGALKPEELLELKAGINTIFFSFPADQLAVGRYLVSIDLTLPNVEYYDRAENCLSFEIARAPINGCIRSFNQSWGYGSFEVHLTRIED
jgi:lipopolysaccharide transport system ATP-binding protein